MFFYFLFLHRIYSILLFVSQNWKIINTSLVARTGNWNPDRMRKGCSTVFHYLYIYDCNVYNIFSVVFTVTVFNCVLVLECKLCTLFFVGKIKNIYFFNNAFVCSEYKNNILKCFTTLFCMCCLSLWWMEKMCVFYSSQCFTLSSSVFNWFL